MAKANAHASGRIVNKAELAQLFGRSVTAVDGWLRRGCPYVQRGSKSQNYQFDVAEVAEWRERQAVERAVGESSDLPFEEGRRRKMAADAALSELDLAKARGEYVSIGVAEQVIGEQLTRCRTRLLEMPTIVSPMVAVEDDVNECREIIDDAVRDALNELVGYGSGGDSLDRDDGSAGDDGKGRLGADAPSAEVDGKRVGGRRAAPKQRSKRSAGAMEDESE